MEKTASYNFDNLMELLLLLFPQAEKPYYNIEGLQVNIDTWNTLHSKIISAFNKSNIKGITFEEIDIDYFYSPPVIDYLLHIKPIALTWFEKLNEAEISKLKRLIQSEDIRYIKLAIQILKGLQ